jgi:hypothetical protein
LFTSSEKIVKKSTKSDKNVKKENVGNLNGNQAGSGWVEIFEGWFGPDFM